MWFQFYRPHVTATGQHNDTRWSTVHPHEYITVDELHFYRRKKPTGSYNGITRIYFIKKYYKFK